MYPHRIRLRGPWECKPLVRADGNDAPLPPPRQMTVPCRWGAGGLPDFAGRVRFQRRFGFPGRLDAHERVWLTFAGASRMAQISLNGTLLGQHEGEDPFAFEVTSLLQIRNELIVEVEGSAPDGGLWGEVALEVRCTAFLRGLQVHATIEGESAFLHAIGEVVGVAERPLELYLLLDGTTVAYETVTATAAGQEFHLVSEKQDATGWQAGETHRVQIDLINGASVWHCHEQACSLAGSKV